MSQMPRKYWTIQETADVLGTTPRTVRRLIANGVLPARRLGPKMVRLRVDDVLNVGRPVPAAEGA